MEPEDDDPNKISPMTDEEAELFRRLRFGQLPTPISRADMIESVDTSRAQPEDEALRDRRFWWYG